MPCVMRREWIKSSLEDVPFPDETTPATEDRRA
jgi:hypothetical protein